jgi:hypothetical protein
MEATKRRNYPHYIILRYTPPKGTLGNLHCITIGRVSFTSKPLDALRPQTDQTGFTNQSDRFWPDSHIESLALALWFSQVTQRFCGEPLETLWTWCGLSPISTHDLSPMSSRLDLGLEAQPRNRLQLRLAVLATMWPTLDPAGHRVPRTKPTCLLHTWRPTSINLSHFFFTCTDTNLAATCTCSTWPRVDPNNVVNHLSY